jgi:hypothetical protein
VLLVDAVRDGAGIVVERLHRRVAEHNARPNATYKLKLTVGKARCEPKVAVTPDQLLAAADDDAFQRKSAPAA